MKKIITLLGCTVIYFSIAAQPSVKIGFKLLPEITLKMTNDPVYDDKNGITHKFKLFSFNYGGQIVVNVTKKIALETGVYTHRQIFSYYVAYYDFTVKESFTFIQVPLLLRLDLSKLYVTCGTSACIQTASLRDYSNGNRESDWTHTNGSVHIGVIGSVGRDWPITKKINILTEIRLSGMPGYAIGGNLGFNVGANYKL